MDLISDIEAMRHDEAPLLFSAIHNVVNAYRVDKGMPALRQSAGGESKEANSDVIIELVPWH